LSTLVRYLLMLHHPSLVEQHALVLLLSQKLVRIQISHTIQSSVLLDFSAYLLLLLLRSQTGHLTVLHHLLGQHHISCGVKT
jgi:hypothetical protein